MKHKEPTASAATEQSAETCAESKSPEKPLTIFATVDALTRSERPAIARAWGEIMECQLCGIKLCMADLMSHQLLEHQ
jgi:hypothetical protein